MKKSVEKITDTGYDNKKRARAHERRRL